MSTLFLSNYCTEVKCLKRVLFGGVTLNSAKIWLFSETTSEIGLRVPGNRGGTSPGNRTRRGGTVEAWGRGGSSSTGDREAGVTWRELGNRAGFRIGRDPVATKKFLN